MVESRAAALAPFPAGSSDLLLAIRAGLITPDHVHAGDRRAGPGHEAGEERLRTQLTLYKSVGVAAQDAAAAALVLEAAEAGVSGPLGGLLVDASPLRDSRHYRRLWTGDLVASAGAQFSTVALPYQVYKETGSSLDVGLLGLAALGPLLAGSLAAGAIADTYDRKKLADREPAVSSLGCLALLVLTVRGDPPLLSLYVLAALLAGSASIESPVRNAVVPLLVGLERLPAAAALNQIVDQTSQIVGPALAGIAIATLGSERVLRGGGMRVRAGSGGRGRAARHAAGRRQHRAGLARAA